MAGRKYMMSGQQKPKLVVTQNFLKELETVVIYGQTVFGDSVSGKFRKGVIARIMALPSMSHANPINRFVESTERKVYRTIIYEHK